MKASLVACVLVWSVILFVGAYLLGCHIQSNTDTAAQAKTKEAERKTLKRKNDKALGAGIRTEQAQAATDANFQRLRADYESDQIKNPGIGCVLDPVSLRRWNDANAQSDSATAGEPDGEVPAAAEDESGRERGQ